MKRIFIYCLILCMTGVGLASCNDDNDELTDSRLTYYPVLTLNGESFVQVPIGTAYKELGCKAVLNGEDYTSKVVTSGTVDPNKAGLYTITYSATNADGFSKSTSRTVAVCDPSITTDMSGKYTVAEGTHRVASSGETPYSGFAITVRKDAPGIFYISDILGGYYDQRAGYGASYAMTGYFQLMADNSVQILSGDVAGWGDSYSDFTDGKYDPATNTISYVVTYAGMEFHVILTL